MLNECIEHIESVLALLEVKWERPFSQKAYTREELMKETLKFCPKTFKHRNMTRSVSAKDDEIDDNVAVTNDIILIVENVKKHVEGTLKDNDLDKKHKDDKKNERENNEVDNKMQV